MIKIAGNTKLLGVVGCPIEHSLSPVMHNAALASCAKSLGQASLEYVYLPLRIESAGLETALLGMAAMGWQGFNVTIPHKQAIMSYLKEVSPLAQAVGAVNTVWRQEGVWHGTNTDVQGFIAPLLKYKHLWRNLDVCILGSGGAARAVIAACAQLECADIHVVGRDPHKLKALQCSLRQTELHIEIQIYDWQALSVLLPRTGLLINTTPVGMHPQISASPLDASMIASLPTNAMVYDLIYTPRPTQLLKLAQQQGCTTLDGLEMLVQQGAAAFKIWTQQSPPIDTMRQAVLEALEAEA